MPDFVKPLYRIRLGDNAYYSADHAWTTVNKDQATLLSHRDARKVRDRLRQPAIKYRGELELE